MKGLKNLVEWLIRKIFKIKVDVDIERARRNYE